MSEKLHGTFYINMEIFDNTASGTVYRHIRLCFQSFQIQTTILDFFTALIKGH